MAKISEKLLRIDQERYKGHISLCEIDLYGQVAMSEARVLIVGAGGLGSPVALYLAAAGIGHIGIVDADTVDVSNLQRQIIHATTDLGKKKIVSAREKLIDINPLIEVKIMDAMISEENAHDIVKNYDIIVDCTDSGCSRLLVSDVCVREHKCLVFGAVMRFSGQLFTYKPGTASYRDIFGDGFRKEATSCAHTGVLNTVLGVVGSLMATEVIKIVTNVGNLLTNKLLVFDALTMKFNTFDVLYTES